MDREEAGRLAVEIARSPEAFRKLIADAILAGAAGTERGYPPEPAAPEPVGLEPIQIWQPEWTAGGPAFTRPAPDPLGDHYAARRTIPAAKPAGVRRVCLFGESAAAGYLYAPWLTPAGLLQETLDRFAGPGGFEVIDLARTNETLAGMETAAVGSLQLDPDVFVVFAGNNWTLLETPDISPHAPDARSRQAFGRMLAEGGPFGPIERGLRLRLERSGAFLAELAAIAAVRGIRVIVVVPEVNLADWADWQPVAWLPGDGTARWHDLLSQALGHLKIGAWERAFTAGEAMLALDSGSCPTTFQVLAWAKEGLGEIEKAALGARAAVDALHYPLMCTLGAPRVTSMDKDLLREGSRHHGFELVDLPEIYAEWTGSPYPGRRMFLDYCHLTVEGMRVATAGIAENILREPGLTWRELAVSAPAPVLFHEQAAGANIDALANIDAAVKFDAAAKFGAALHSAHRMPGHHRREEILEYWIEAALDADPGVEVRMLDLVEARASGGRIELTMAHARNRATAAPVLYAHGWDYPHLDAAAIEAIRSVLERRGSPGAGRLVEKLAQSVDGPVELTDPYFHAEPLERPFVELDRSGDRRAILKAYWPETEFVFLLDGKSGCRLTVCARLPGSGGDTPAEGTVGVRINGAELEPLFCDGRWRTEERLIPAGFLPPGVNRLRLGWPRPAGDGDQALADATGRLLAAEDAALFPVFGELYSVRLEIVPVDF